MENRLRSIRKELKMTQEALAERMGIGKSALSMIETGKAALSKRNRNILVQEFNVNPDWLESGAGNMFNAPPPEFCSAGDRGGKGTLPVQDIPLYSIETLPSLSALFSDNTTFRPVSCLRIPSISKCDGALFVTGNGMYPLLKTGDIVIYKQVSDPEDIFWGEMYLLSVMIDGEEFVTVKYIFKSQREGYVRLVSENTQHEDKDVELTKISAMAFIKASIRMNSIG